MQSNLEQTFGALADPVRLAVIRLLRKKPLRSSELAAALSLSRPTMSRHLQMLRKSGLVQLVDEAQAHDAHDARVRMYQLRPDPFTAMRSWLDEVEAFWGDQLRAFKTHAERKYGKRRK